MDPETQKIIDDLQRRIAALEDAPPDHVHSGFDQTRISFADLDTIIAKQVTINPSNLNDGVGETQDVTVVGAVLGDWVLVSPPYDLQGITMTAWVKSNSTISVRFQNETGGAINLASGTYRVLVIKKIV